MEFLNGMAMGLSKILRKMATKESSEMKCLFRVRRNDTKIIISNLN
jgi:hypothetical protein